MIRATLMITMSITFMVYASNGMYIKPIAENESSKIKNKDEWSVFKQKLGLTNQKGSYFNQTFNNCYDSMNFKSLFCLTSKISYSN